ncbi:MAG: hypothetical protein IJ184_00955 [Alphaproteobacteria bacterium]|nr:hypothetical protein [Alphaproteobacteria bacterium]
MSQDETRSAEQSSALPQFMKEEKNYIEMQDDDASWLNNNLHKLMLGVSAVWFSLVLIYITQFFGWSNLFLMMPDEFGGFMAGITLPLVVIWVAMAYIDRGTSFKKEAKFLRAYMNQLVYPEEEAPKTAKAFADAIRSQVVELREVSKLAHEQTHAIKDAIKENVDDFAKLVSKLDGYSSHTIVELSEGVKFLMSNFENIVNQAQSSSSNLSTINQKFIADSEMISGSLSELFQHIIPALDEIKTTAAELKSIASGSIAEMNKSNTELKDFSLIAEKNFNGVQTILNNQIDLLEQVSEKAFESCEGVRSKAASEIADIEEIFKKHISKLENLMGNIAQEVKTKSDDLSKYAEHHISIINNTIKNQMGNVGSIFDEQIHKMNEALAQQNRDISSLNKTIDDRAALVTQKFASHSELINQELDKLMVRSSNLEDGVAMRVANLNGVADKTIATIQNVESALNSHVALLSDKIAVANDDVTSYIDTLNDKTDEFISMSGSITELTANLNSRYQELQKVMSTSLNQLHEADKDINASTENLLVQTAQSSESLNQVASIMQKHTSGLTDAAAVVTTQSQISEASLLQQQKYITDTASHVELIKDELKRQIDELSAASDELEANALRTSDNLKNNIDKMLRYCSDALDKGKIINDNIADQATDFDTSINKTLTKVTQFENMLSKQLQNIEGVGKKIDTQTDNITKRIDTCSQKLEETGAASVQTISDAVSDFALKADNIQTVSKNAAEYIDNVASTIDTKVVGLNVTFRQQEADFYAYSNKMSDSTAKMVDVIKKQMNEISSDTDKIYAKMTVLEEGTADKADAVVANLQKSLQKFSEIARVFEEQNQHNAKSIDDTIAKFGSINDALSEKMDRFDAKVKDIGNELSSSVDKMNVSSAKLKSMQQDMVKETGRVWQKLNEQTKYMEGTFAKLQSQGSHIADLFENQKNNISEVVNSVITQTRLGEASMAQQYKYLTDATVEVAAKMQGINTAFKNNTGEIFDAANKMSYEFDVLGDRLLKACDALQKSAKDSVKNIDQVSLRLNQCNEDLDAAIFHSVENIGGVFSEYEKYQAGFNTITAETSTGVVEINRLISAQSDKMVKISDDSKKLVDCFNNILNDTSAQLTKRADDAFDKVKDLGQKLKQLSNEMDDAAQLTATHLEKSGDKLRVSVSEIAANAERISNNILSSGEVFVKQSQALSALADSAAAKVNQSLTDLVEAGRNFEEQGQSLLVANLKFGENVSEQMKTLSDTSARAEKAAKNLAIVYRDVKVDTFIKDSTKIINALANTSVDINRLLNPKGEDDLWKRYYNGDNQIFIRTLAKNMTSAQSSELRKAFEKNDELRKLVINYMSEFESLVEKSKDHEHAGTLMAVIFGSDIGRLYYILSKALNKLN